MVCSSLHPVCCLPNPHPGFVIWLRPVLPLDGPCPRSSPQRPLDLEAVLLREPGGLDTWPHPAWSAGRAHLDKSLGREDERGQQELLPCNGLLHPSPQHRLPLDHHQRPLKGLGDWYLKHRLLHYSSSTAANEQVLTCKTKQECGNCPVIINSLFGLGPSSASSVAGSHSQFFSFRFGRCCVENKSCGKWRQCQNLEKNFPMNVSHVWQFLAFQKHVRLFLISFKSQHPTAQNCDLTIKYWADPLWRKKIKLREHMVVIVFGEDLDDCDLSQRNVINWV